MNDPRFFSSIPYQRRRKLKKGMNHFDKEAEEDPFFLMTSFSFCAISLGRTSVGSVGVRKHFLKAQTRIGYGRSHRCTTSSRKEKRRKGKKLDRQLIYPECAKPRLSLSLSVCLSLSLSLFSSSSIPYILFLLAIKSSFGPDLSLFRPFRNDLRFLPLASKDEVFRSRSALGNISARRGK